MTGSNRKGWRAGTISGGMKYSLFAFLICVAVVVSPLLVQPGVQNVSAEASSVDNDRVGDLVVFSQDYTGMGSIPGNICLAADSMSGSVTNLNLSYNAASHCVSVDAAEGAVGKLFVGGLSPSLSTAITIDMGMGRTEDHATVNVYVGGAWLAIRLRNGTPTDDLIITSNYYTYSNPTLHSATSVTEDVGFNDGGRFEIAVVSDCASRTNTIYLNDVEKLTTPYTRYLPYSLTTVYDPFVNPFVHFAFDSIYSGQTAYLQLYSVEQTVPEYSYVTPISNPKLTSFGVDGPHPWETVDYGLSLLDHGTIWADVGDLEDYSPSEMDALKALIADGWELGIHYGARLYDLPLANAVALMDAETAEIAAIFGESPTTWCSLQGADNITHAEYAYTSFGMVSRTGVNGCGAGLSSIANLGDNCWTFWSIASAAGVVVPTFSHQLDVTPAIVWSISADKFSSYVSNYENRGVQIIGFREYWEKAQNSHHTAISNVLSDPGVSLGFTVANIGGKSRLLVNAPWATTVRDGSGGEVPFEVAGSGIVVEVEAGNYTVSAGLHADFSADKTAAVIGQAIQFTNLSAGGAIPLSYEWDFGDSTGSTLQNPSHSYGSAGTYTVALQVTDSAEETDTETKASYITVTAAPPPNHPPDTPVNSSPANGAGGVSLTPLLQSAAFSDADGGDTHMASRWQVRVISGSYANPAYDSGTVATHLTGITLPPGALSHSTTYYWRVRHQDNHAAWSDWSSETSFTAIDPPNQVPGQPSNVSPPDGAAAVSLLPTLQSSAFSDPDVGDIHAASQWQVRATGGEYSDPVYDSGTVATDLTSLSVPVGELGYSTIYYWRVRHQDDDSAWSEWSSETSFATVDPPNQLPGQPSNVSPANGASAVDVAPTLQSSAFSDPDVEDIHAASQWQVTAISGDYSSPAYDSGTAAGDLTSVSVPAGGLDYSITYYWRVRHQDDDSAWSDWSSETWFATVDPPNHPPGQPGNVTPASGVTGVSLIPALTSSAFSDPDAGDAHAASQWQIRTVTGSYSSPVFDSATDTANLAAVNIPSGALTYSTAYYWRARHQDNHGAWSDWSAETSFATVGPPVDSTPPSIPAVSDDGLSTTVATSLHANWASTDPESGVVEFEYAVGTSPGGTDVVGWTSAGGASGANQTGLSLTVGTTYYFSVRARNGAGLWSATGGSDGITVVDEEDTTPAPSDVEDEGIALWILLPVMFGLIAAPGFAIYFLRRRPGAG